jgi:hypothetical protein
MVGPDVVDTGLVLVLDAADKLSYPGSGTSWIDLSGNNRTGTLTNGPTFSAGNQGSIVFDGTNDNIQLGNASNFLPTSAITINCWLKTNAAATYKKIFVTVSSGGGSTGLQGIYLSTGSPPYNLYLGIITNIGEQSATTTQDLSTTSFSNLCGTYDGSNIRLYLNTTLVATQAQTGTINNGGIARISGYDSNAETWNGNIATFSIYNRALSATEILQNYNAVKSRFGL